MTASSSDELSDLALIKSFQDGDESALQLLLKRRLKWFYNIALRTVSDPTLAEEGVQEALVKIWKGAKGFRGESQVTTWMYQIVVRSCIDLLRKEKLQKNEPLPDELENLIPSPLNFESQLVDSLLVHGALQELGQKEQEILTLVWLEELTYEEISKRLDLPLGTVKSRASRAQTKFKAVLEEILSERRNQRSSTSVKEMEVSNVKHFRPRS